MISFVIVSKDEPGIAQTLDATFTGATAFGEDWETIVVDASRGRFDQIRRTYPSVRWFDYEPPNGVTVSIAHQRNLGVRRSRGDVVVFTDAGCVPQPGWLTALLRPILMGAEDVCVGRTIGRDLDLYDAGGASPDRYLRECSTINLAVRRSVFDALGGFDESFAYGSDVDFSWRLTDRGLRLRSAPDAVVIADWGGTRRQLRRAWAYGRARARLYAKHRHRWRTCWRDDPAPVAYALFLLGLPLTAVWPLYPGLLVVGAIRNRRTGPFLTVADHLLLSAGALSELARLLLSVPAAPEPIA
jgi:hypothetical protein